MDSLLPYDAARQAHRTDDAIRCLRCPAVVGWKSRGDAQRHCRWCEVHLEGTSVATASATVDVADAPSTEVQVPPSPAQHRAADVCAVAEALLKALDDPKFQYPWNERGTIAGAFLLHFIVQHWDDDGAKDDFAAALDCIEQARRGKDGFLPHWELLERALWFRGIKLRPELAEEMRNAGGVGDVELARALSLMDLLVGRKPWGMRIRIWSARIPDETLRQALTVPAACPDDPQAEASGTSAGMWRPSARPSRLSSVRGSSRIGIAAVCHTSDSTSSGISLRRRCLSSGTSRKCETGGCTGCGTRSRSRPSA